MWLQSCVAVIRGQSIYQAVARGVLVLFALQKVLGLFAQRRCSTMLYARIHLRVEGKHGSMGSVHVVDTCVHVHFMYTLQPASTS